MSSHLHSGRSSIWHSKVGYWDRWCWNFQIRSYYEGKNPSERVSRLTLKGGSQLTHHLQSLIPVVMSGIIAVYGLVIAVLIAQAVGPTTNMSLYTYVLRAGWTWELDTS